MNRFYRTVWRWHFYAGLFVIPFMMILASTGIIYLFKPQLDALMYRSQLFVQPAAVIAPYTAQLNTVEQQYTDAAITKFTPNIAPDRSSEIELTTSTQQKLTVFVNPHTAEILGTRDQEHNLQSIARKIHGELMIGQTGDYLVEMAACWGLVLLISGLYLWWPREAVSLKGTLVPRLWSKSRRIFWRDLHAVPGFYGALLMGFLILTGLPWSGFWGETFANVWGRFPAQMWDDIPISTVLTGSLNQHGSQVVPWAVEQMPMPLSSPMPNSASHAQHSQAQHSQSQHQTHTGTPTAQAAVNLDSVIALAQAKGAPAGFSVSFPEGETGVYTVAAFPDNPAYETTMHIDQYSGKVLADLRWQDYGLVPRAVELGIAIHMGKYFGLANQLLMLCACLVIGAVMWWQRRPEDRLGAPPLPDHVQHWRIPLAIVAVLGLAFPLVGLSLIVVLLLDYLLLSRIPAFKRLIN
jgi:uncharacterized iron-regulated membrane protein